MNDTKPALKSSAIQGALAVMIAVICSKLFGFKVPTDTVTAVSSLIGSIPADWAMLTTAFVGVITRVLAWDFDKSRLRSRTFWISLLTAIFGLANVLGVDTAAFQDVTVLLEAMVAKYAPVAASLYMLFGAAKAKRAIAV